ETLPEGMVMAAPLGPGVDRIIVCPHGTPPRDATERPLTYPEAADARQRITGEDIRGGSALWVSASPGATRQASEPRRGRAPRAAQGVLLDLGDDPAVRELAAGWKDRVITVTGTPAPVDGADPLAGAAAVLIRPDGYVAWAGTPGVESPGAASSPGSLAAALRR